MLPVLTHFWGCSVSGRSLTNDEGLLKLPKASGWLVSSDSLGPVSSIDLSLL